MALSSFHTRPLNLPAASPQQASWIERSATCSEWPKLEARQRMIQKPGQGNPHNATKMAGAPDPGCPGGTPANGNAAMQPPPAKSLLDRLRDARSSVAGTEKLEGFNLRDFFSGALQRRTTAEIEDYLIVGTLRPPPPLSEVQTGWPRPWFFARFLIFFGLLYLGLGLAYQHFHNECLLPGLVLIGAFAAPGATLIFFFELNSPRNVSIYQLVILLSLGSIVSLFISLIGYDLSGLSWLGASSAGIIEETGKLLALILIVRSPRYGYILNGMLFGAAVGAGFGSFESAAEALHALAHPGAPAMMHSIAVRGMLAPLMHVALPGMLGAAL